MKKSIITLALIAVTLIGGCLAWNQWGWMTSFDMPFEPLALKKKRIAYMDLKHRYFVFEVVDHRFEFYGSGNWSAHFLFKSIMENRQEGMCYYEADYNDQNQITNLNAPPVVK